MKEHTQPESLHDDSLPREAGIAVQLNAHHAIPGLALRLARALKSLEQGELLRTRLAQGDRIDRLEVRWIRQQGDPQGLRRARILEVGRRRYEEVSLRCDRPQPKDVLR